MSALPDDVVRVIVRWLLAVAACAQDWRAAALTCRRLACLCAERADEAMWHFKRQERLPACSWWRLPSGVMHGEQVAQVRLEQRSCWMTRWWWRGRPHGWEQTHFGARLLHQVLWLHGQREGPELYVTLAGRLWRVRHWHRGVLDGPEMQWTRSGARLLSAMCWRGGQRHGWERHYHNNGRVRCEREWRNNALHGVERRYRRDGTLYYTCVHEHGLIHGLEVRWNATAAQSVPVVEFWQRGVRVPAVVQLDANGAIAGAPVPVALWVARTPCV